MKNIFNNKVNLILIVVIIIIILFNICNSKKSLEGYYNLTTIDYDFKENKMKIHTILNHIATNYFKNVSNNLDLTRPETIDIDTLKTINGEYIQREINNMQNNLNDLTINDINYLLAYAEIYKSYFNYILITTNDESKKLKLQTYIVIIDAGIEKLISNYINLKDYYFDGNLATWDEHNKNARNLGYDGLVCIQNKQELNHILQLIPSNATSIWIGGERKNKVPPIGNDGPKSNIYWKWNDNSLWNTNGIWNDNTEIWNTGEPNNSGGNNTIKENGIEMENLSGKWNDLPKERKLYAIYQKVLDPNPNKLLNDYQN